MFPPNEKCGSCGCRPESVRNAMHIARQNLEFIAERDAILAEAGALRDVLEHAIELGYLGEGSTRGMAQDALDTAPLSRAIAAVINRAKMLSWEDLPDGNYLIGKHAAERLIRALEALEEVRK